MDSIQTINQAIRHGRQIRFKYLSYSFDNMRTQVERRSGKFYVVNPYKMLIDNGLSVFGMVISKWGMYSHRMKNRRMVFKSLA